MVSLIPNLEWCELAPSGAAVRVYGENVAVVGLVVSKLGIVCRDMVVWGA